jgi:hypothetical protein
MMDRHFLFGGNVMRVLAARFPDRRIASAVREMLQRRLHLDAPDVDIAPLGVPGQPATSDNDMLLAGKFADDQAAEVAELVRAAGGEIVANVDEKWTRPRSFGPASSWNSVFKRDRLHA